MVYLIILLDNGKLYFKNFKKAKLDLDEFLMLCRTNGYFNLIDIQTALVNQKRGRLSEKNLTKEDWKERYQILKKYQAFLKAQRERK